MAVVRVVGGTARTTGDPTFRAPRPDGPGLRGSPGARGLGAGLSFEAERLEEVVEVFDRVVVHTVGYCATDSPLSAPMATGIRTVET
jgi:hypothetical protein